MRCLVTGGAGFIGRHLIRYLEIKGHDVVGVDMKSDLRIPENALRVTKDIEWVFNLAALNGSIEYTTSNHAELTHNNAMVNLNMAEACWKNGVTRVFYSSSACVYPIHYQETEAVHPLKEEDVDPAHPDTEYGWEKLFSEHVWQSYAQDRALEVRIGRFFNIYGPEGSLDPLMSKAPMALTKKVIDAGQGGEVPIWGDGVQKRSFCYIDDCLDAIMTVMESDVTTPVNIGTEELVSISELVDMIAENEGISVKKVFQLDRIQGVRTRHSDLSKIKAMGWEAKIPLKEGLKRLAVWYRSHHAT